MIYKYSFNRTIVVLLSILFIAACDVEEEVVNNTLQLNPGGTYSAPAQMSFDIPNEIKASYLDNYFSFGASLGDTIVFNSSLIKPIEGSEYMGCQMGIYFFTNVTTGSSACIAHLKGTFGADSDRIYHFSFPNNSGYFNAAIIPANTIFSPTANSTGRPDDPKTINLSNSNSLSANSFYNNFIYNAQVGETLQIQTYPDVLPSDTDNLTCQTTGQNFGSPYSYGVQLDNNLFNCSNTFEYYFAQAGQYNLNIRLLVGVGGYFTAVVF